ncbi:LCP family protein [Candidatus Peregrinibacteria bacterium]|nr:LCP family protein [Candidatus Peregrinibacteria bacterium]
MNFKKTPIQKASNSSGKLQNFSEWKTRICKVWKKKKIIQKHHPGLFFLTLAAGIIAGAFLILSTYGLIKNGGLLKIIQPLKVDNENRTNVLLLGTGTEDHEGSDLTDTVMVASLDHEKQTLSIISLPRDLYIVTEFGPSRINQIYEHGLKSATKEKGLEVLKTAIQKIIGMQIHYYAKIDFKGFEEFVDAIGGVDIFVDQKIIDTSYPKGETFEYETFVLEKGPRHLDGKTALKYARTRKCTICLDGDFGRAKRQHQILNAIKDKTISAKTLLSPSKIKNIFQIIRNNFDSDLNVNDFLYIAAQGKNFSNNTIFSWVIHDNPDQAGGFLYVPERKYYGGAFVLLPTTNPMGFKDENPYYEINDFADLVMKHPKIMQEATTIKILNGTRINSFASLTFRYLARYGFNAVQFGNNTTRDKEKTIIYDTKNKNPEILTLLQKRIPGEIQHNVPEDIENTENVDIIVILGQDFYEFYKTNKARFY